MPLIEEASKNVSDKLNMSYEDAYRILSNLTSECDDNTKFFFFRSLINQVNLTDCRFQYLSLDEKEVLLGWYLGRHESLCLGYDYLSYDDRAFYMSRSFYKNLEHSSLYLYVKQVQQQGANFSSDCLFPRQNMNQCSDFQKVWQSVTSYWVSNGHKKVDARKIPSFMALCFNIDPSNSKYRYFMSDADPERLYQAIRYTPTLNRNMSWASYKTVPLLAPLPCVSPFGFDYMAFMVFDYLDKVRPANLWK